MTQLFPYAGPYIPRADTRFAAWISNFASIIASDPPAFGLTQAIADELVAAVEAFNAAYTVAVTPETRTTQTVSRKNTVRKQVEKLFRTYAQWVKTNPNIDDAFKRGALLLHPGEQKGETIRRPQSRPMLMIVMAKSGRHVLRYHDDSMEVALRKPADAAALQLFGCVDWQLSWSEEKAKYIGTYTKQPIVVRWPQKTAGMTAVYRGRWVNAKGEEGPWSSAAMMQIAFGGPVLEQIDRARQVMMKVTQRAAA